MSSDWQPLSVREGQREPDGPFEGVPDHLREGLKQWLITVFGIHNSSSYNPHLISHVAAAVRVSLERNPKRHDFDGRVVELMAVDETTLLDAVDVCLHLTPSHLVQDYQRDIHKNRLVELQDTLKLAGSVWRIDKSDTCLVRRVDPVAQTAYERALTADEAASEELATAWRACYGRYPDPSDAWDHAIKAVEHVLKPVVSPKNNSATLGTIIRNLKDGKHKFTLALAASDGDELGRLIGMLELMWPNPDRHGGGGHRKPTLREAQAVVQLAITVVQWARDGVLGTKAG